MRVPHHRLVWPTGAWNGERIPVVSIDGWVRIINDHPHYDGVEFVYSDEMVVAGAGTTKHAHVWVEAVIYRKDIGRPIRVREYLDEVYQPPRNSYNGPWQTHPKRFQRHKALIQGARVALGFGGIYDEDEAQRIEQASVRPVNTGVAELQRDLQQLAAERQEQRPVIEHVQDEVITAVAAAVVQQEAEPMPVDVEPEPKAEQSKTFNPFEQDRFPE